MERSKSASRQPLWYGERQRGVVGLTKNGSRTPASRSAFRRRQEASPTAPALCGVVDCEGPENLLAPLGASASVTTADRPFSSSARTGAGTACAHVHELAAARVQAAAKGAVEERVSPVEIRGRERPGD